MTGRDTLAALQWRRLSSLIDHEFSDPGLLEAAAAGREPAFGRLAFLGERILALAVLVGLARASVTGDEAASQRLASLVADSAERDREQVSTRSMLAGLVGLGSRPRRNPYVLEAAAAALFLDGRWIAVDRLAVATGLVPRPAPPSPQGGQIDPGGLEPSVATAATRALGAATVDATLAWWTYRTMPERDGETLRAMAAQRGSERSLATIANRHPELTPPGRPADRLRRWVGTTTLERGRAAGGELVSSLLDLGPCGL